MATDDDAPDPLEGMIQERKRRKRHPAATADDGADEFADLPDPASEDPATLMSVVRMYQARALRVAATKPLTEGLVERLKFIERFGASIGVTQVRADLEERVVAVEQLVEHVKPHGAVTTTETHGHARAATSSRGGSTRRLRTVPGPTPGPRSVPADGRPPQAPDGDDDPDGGGAMG